MPSDGVEQPRPASVDAVGEVVQERGLGKTAESVPVDEAGVGRWRRERLGERRIVLARVGRPGCDVDQADDVRVAARLGDTVPPYE